MYYTLLIIGFIALIAIVCKIISFSAEPDFSLYAALTEEGLKNKIATLAGESRFYSLGGKGLSLNIIRSEINKGYKILSKKNPLSLLEFEKWLFDNYYKLEETIIRQKSVLQNYKKLPHINGLPRIYRLAEAIVKYTNAGFDKKDIAKLIGVYNSVTPLTFYEIAAFKSALEYALLEYITVFYAKSSVINVNFKKAERDISHQKFNIASINYNSYLYRINLCDDINFKYIVDNICRSNGQGLENRADIFIRLASDYNSCVGSAIKNLHKSVELDDNFIIERSSLNSLLYGYPLYEKDTLATKYALCFEIAKRAKKSGKSELYIARRLMDESEVGGETLEKKVLVKHKDKKFQKLFIFIIISLSITFSVLWAFVIGRFYLALLLFPISFAVIRFIQSEILSVSFKGTFLPRTETEQIKKTMITVTRLIKDAQEVEDAFSHLEIIRAANGKKLFGFSLLIDLIDSDTENCDSDKEILDTVNKLYNDMTDNSDINVFIRSRILCGDGKYRGWEKKRGALLQLNDYFLNKNEEPFKLILGKYFAPEYIITLDCDTLINCAAELVRIMEHPANRDINVLGLNMRVTPEASQKSGFSELMSGSIGLDSYARHGVEAEYDLFGQGNYTGKGIYRVSEFHKKVSEIFPDERILSHDFIEGAVAGCANCDECGLEDYPINFSQFLSRQLRWLRGDWQLLPFLRKNVKNRKGEKIKNPISPIAKYHIFSNMVYGLIPIVQMIILIFSAFIFGYGIIFSAFLINVLYIINSLRLTTLKSPKLAFKEFRRQFFSIVLLPTVAINNLLTIAVTLVRLIRKKNLLVWKTAAHYRGKISSLPNYIAALLFLIAAYFQNKFFILISLIFVVGAFVNIFLSRPKTFKENKTKDEEYIKSIAHKTWNFFADNLKEEYNYLIPDNVNEDNVSAVAERTSPTNIGFSMVAAAAAYELEFIDFESFKRIISNITSTIERLKKWNGHLYNWIDIKSLNPLEPRYVSTIDSGNLLACLMSVKNYFDCELKDRIQRLIDNIDFSVFFDKRGLLKIEYNDSEKRYEDNYYDLMGSESLLTYLCAIGCGKIEKGAWDNLSRQCVKYKGTLLFSWTGGMFEYLMCPLFFDYFRNTLLYKTAKNAVRSQIYYAKKKKYPFWGISESQYNALNEWENYQYKAFGIPNIALSVFKESEVIAPYATALAYKFDPESALSELERLDEVGMVGRYGYYESMDRDKIIKSYMAHHQGMIILSLTQALRKGAVIDKFMLNPEAGAAKMLLTESSTVIAKRKKQYPLREDFYENVYKINGVSKIPYYRFYTNKRYYLACNERGENYACFDGIRIDCGGETGDKLEIEYNQNKYNIISYNSTVYDRHNIKYIFKNNDIIAETTISVMSQVNGDVRKLKLRNIGSETIDFLVRSTKKLCLCKYEDYLAHPAFSQMNIETSYDKDLKYLSAKKKNNSLFYAHFTSNDNTVYNANGLSERNKKIEKKFGYTLYPVAQSLTEVKLNPGECFELNIFNIVSYDKSFFAHIIPLLKTFTFFNAMVGTDFALNKIFSLDKNISEIASVIMGGYNVPETSLGGLFDINFPLITEQIKFEFELDIEKKRLAEIAELYNYGIKFNVCLIVSANLRTQTDKLLQLIDFVSKVRYGKFVIVDDDNELCEKIIRNSVKVDFNLFKNYGVTKLNSYNKTDEKLNKEMKLKISYPMGIGGFNDNFEYLIPLNEPTPKPWSNVLADEEFGSIVTESGGGFTFAANSRQQKFTDFKNDCIYDIPTEKILFFDKKYMCLWSATKKPFGAGTQWTKHSFGYTEFITNYCGIKTSLIEFVALKNKYFILDIENCDETDRILNIAFACDFALGDFGENTLNALKSQERNGCLFIENTVNGMKAYLRCDKNTEVIKLGDFDDLKDFPFADKGRLWFKRNTGALILTLKISSGKKDRCAFCLGTAQPEFNNYENLLKNIKIKNNNLTSIEIKTEKKEIDALLKWLPYQAYNSRFMAKAGYYQVSGAFGFRDQLQDCLTLLYIDPDKVRQHILRCAGRQYEDGDVQHWWHYPDDMGIRTYFCDDRLFLPYITAEYIAFTGDKKILSERINYLKNKAIPVGSKDVYHRAEKSEICESLEEHCLNCIFSENISDEGLLRIGGGDWYDAMDELGIKGKGITVWGTMFLYFVINQFLPYVSNKIDREKLFEMRFKLLEGINKCWDKDRFIRAISDSGVVIGSDKSTECKLDLLTQCWSVISGAAENEKGGRALEKAKELIDKENKIIKILSPPLEKTKNVGYITNYPLGIRENGGQYTHAAVWYIISLFLTEKIQDAYELIKMINPINHSLTYKDVIKYKAEPYVICGDVYSGESAGEGGWSWYTGAASWTYVCLIEYLFGIKLCDNEVKFNPLLPEDFDKVEINIATSFGNLPIIIDNSVKKGKWKIFIGNRVHSTDTLKLDPELIDKKIVIKRD